MSFVKRLANGPKNIVTGFIIIFLVGFITMGGDFLSMMAMSVICTLGVGLVIWVGLAYIVGLITWLIIAPFINRKNNETTDNSVSEQLRSSKLLAIIKFIKEARSIGMTDDKIKERLFDNGWTEKEIETGFNLTSSATS